MFEQCIKPRRTCANFAPLREACFTERGFSQRRKGAKFAKVLAGNLTPTERHNYSFVNQSALLPGDARIRIPVSPFNSIRFQFASRLSEARLETKYILGGR